MHSQSGASWITVHFRRTCARYVARLALEFQGLQSRVLPWRKGHSVVQLSLERSQTRQLAHELAPPWQLSAPKPKGALLSLRLKLHRQFQPRGGPSSSLLHCTLWEVTGPTK